MNKKTILFVYICISFFCSDTLLSMQRLGQLRIKPPKVPTSPTTTTVIRQQQIQGRQSEIPTTAQPTVSRTGIVLPPTKAPTIPLLQGPLSQKPIALPKYIELPSEKRAIDIKQAKTERSELASFFNQALRTHQAGFELGSVSKNVIGTLTEKDKAFGELFLHDTNEISTEENGIKKVLFKSTKTALGNILIRFKTSDIRPTIYMLIAPGEKAPTDLVNQKHKIQIQIKEVNDASIPEILQLFEPILEKTETRKLENELAAKRAILEKIEAERLAAQEAAEQERIAQIEQITQETLQELSQEYEQTIAAYEQAQRNLLAQEMSDFKNIEAEQKVVEQNIADRDKTITELSQKIEFLEQQQQQNLQKQAEAQNEYEMQQAQQAGQNIKEQKDIVEQEQSQKVKEQEQSTQRLERLETEKAQIQQEYQEKSQILEKEKTEATEEQERTMQKIQEQRQEELKAIEQKAEAEQAQLIKTIEKEQQELNEKRQQRITEQETAQKLLEQKYAQKQIELDALEQQYQQILQSQPEAKNEHEASLLQQKANNIKDLQEQTQKDLAELEELKNKRNQELILLKNQLDKEAIQREINIAKELKEKEELIQQKVEQLNQEIAQRKIELQANIEAQATQRSLEVAAQEIQERGLSEQTKKDIAQQRLKDQKEKDEQNQRDTDEIAHMESQLKQFVETREKALQSIISYEKAGQAKLEKEIDKITKALEKSELTVTQKEEEQKADIIALKNTQQILSEQLKTITNDIQTTQQEIEALEKERSKQQPPAEIKKTTEIEPEVASLEILAKPKETIESGGDGAIKEDEEKKTEKKNQTPEELQKAAKLTVPAIPLLLQPTIESDEIAMMVEPQEIPTPPEKKSMFTSKIPTTAMTTTTTTAQYLPSMPTMTQRIRSTSPTITTQRSTFQPSSVITQLEKMRPTKTSSPSGSMRSIGGQPFRVPGYSGTSNIPSYISPNYSFDSQSATEEKPFIPYGQVKLTKSKPEQTQVPITIPEPEQEMIMTQEEAPEQETWKPLPPKPRKEKIIPEETPVTVEKIGWFEKIIMRIMEYIKQLFGK